MNSYEEMRARDRALSHAAGTTEAARTAAVYDAHHAINRAHRLVRDRVGGSSAMMDAAERRTGVSPDEKRSAIEVAACSKLVEEAVKNLEQALVRHSSPLQEIESLQVRLSEAEQNLKRALEVRKHILEQQQTDARSAPRGVAQTDWVASDEAVAELDTVDGCIAAQVAAFEKFARAQLQRR